MWRGTHSKYEVCIAFPCICHDGKWRAPLGHRAVCIATYVLADCRRSFERIRAFAPVHAQVVDHSSSPHIDLFLNFGRPAGEESSDTVRRSRLNATVCCGHHGNFTHSKKVLRHHALHTGLCFSCGLRRSRSVASESHSSHHRAYHQLQSRL